MKYARFQPGDKQSQNRKDALNIPLETFRKKRNKRRRAYGLPGVTENSFLGHEKTQERPEITDTTILTHASQDVQPERVDPHDLLTRLYYRVRTTNDLEDLCERAKQAGHAILEDRCLEDLATRRARGTWIATHRRPLPGGAFSNLRKS